MLAKYFDSTNLKPEATENDIRLLCTEAVKYSMAAVCIHPGRLAVARQYLQASQVKLCTVLGFPLGADMLSTKIYAAQMALDQGADELDMVINIGAVKDNNYKLVEQEITSLLGLKNHYPLAAKIIVETALLTSEELITLTRLVSDTGADYIKTSTGFGPRGVSREDINIINANKGDKLKIKASGGIRTLDFALELIAAGVDRLGSSNAAKILEEYKRK